eukprot:TRINITY_DN7529_c0_g2_i1.p2 TRINITY_DN7529_c0_g2~~TRINITY_DN7529_c0_g2_i1.p2  ORF type:complete len:209 (-),score=30.28 TRINITY_DN7529_c0_g2_i1:624-1250(-)
MNVIFKTNLTNKFFQVQLQNKRINPRRLNTTQINVTNDPYKLLELDKGCNKMEIRKAYLKQMKIIHPDVNPDMDTTQKAIAINKAYKELMSQNFENSDSDQIGDVFDERNGEVQTIFVNPFACYGVDPMQWRELQKLIENNFENDVEDVLYQNGISASTAAINYLTQDQYDEIVREMMLMERCLSFESTSWYLADCLVRAQRVNNMMG